MQAEFARAEEEYRKAREYEDKNDFEAAILFFESSASLFLSVIRSEQNPKKKTLMKEIVEQALTRLAALKKRMKPSVAEETKKEMHRLSSMEIAKAQPSGVLLFEESWSFYYRVGQALFSKLSSKKYLAKSILLHFFIAAENLKKIIDATRDEYSIAEKKLKLKEIISFIENLKSFMSSDPQYSEPNIMSSVSPQTAAIMKAASTINGNEYPLWLPSMGAINVYSPALFTDPAGFLPLSGKQMSRFSKWSRAKDIYNIQFDFKSPPFSIAYNINGYEVKQSMVGDCSVVSSLAICAHYEYKFNYSRRLISSNIFPQDEYGNPVYNPCGKYAVRLFFNGKWRLVEVDDFFPIDKNNRMICASSNKKQLWVPLLEKAYLKLHGGYNFRGSVSSTDLYTFTSWLPEKLAFKEYPLSKLWERIKNGIRVSDCLITIGTGDVQNEEAIGLKSHHAYGVLEVIEEGGLKLMLVKNPWCSFRWQGRFSEHDTINWTPDLKKKCHVEDLAESDNGIFWIDFESVSENFEYMDINWNPALLQFRESVYDTWDAREMSDEDYNLSKNPQYAVTIKPTHDSVCACILWIIITKIVQDTDELEQDDDFIAMHVYERGAIEKVKYSEHALKRSVYTNEQHYLLSLDVDKQRLITNNRHLILVLSQYKRKKDLNYTIQFLCSHDFILTPLKEQFSHVRTVEVPMTPEICGGTPSSPYFYKNPQYLIKAKAEGPGKDKPYVRISIESQTGEEYIKSWVVNVVNKERVAEIDKEHVVATSGEKYRPGYCVTELNIPTDRFYHLILSTYNTSMLGTYTITFQSLRPLDILQIQPEGAGLMQTVINVKMFTFQGTWTALRCGGNKSQGSFSMNPCYVVNLTRKSEIIIRLRVTEERSIAGVITTNHKDFQMGVNLSLFSISASYPPAPGSIKLDNLSHPILSTHGGNYSNNLSSIVAHKVSYSNPKQKDLSMGVYALIPSSFHSQQQGIQNYNLGKYEIQIFSSSQISYHPYQVQKLPFYFIFPAYYENS